MKDRSNIVVCTSAYSFDCFRAFHLLVLNSGRFRHCVKRLIIPDHRLKVCIHQKNLAFSEDKSGTFPTFFSLVSVCESSLISFFNSIVTRCSRVSRRKPYLCPTKPSVSARIYSRIPRPHQLLNLSTTHLTPLLHLLPLSPDEFDSMWIASSPEITIKKEQPEAQSISSFRHSLSSIMIRSSLSRNGTPTLSPKTNFLPGSMKRNAIFNVLERE